MKTTLDIDDELLIRAKAASAREHKSLTAFIEEGLRLRLRRQGAGRRHSAPALAIHHGKGGLVAGIEMAELGREWPALKQLSRQHRLAANDITDAWIAAAVRTLGSHLVTFDRSFARLLDRREFTLLPPTASP